MVYCHGHPCTCFRPRTSAAATASASRRSSGDSLKNGSDIAGHDAHLLRQPGRQHAANRGDGSHFQDWQSLA